MFYYLSGLQNYLSELRLFKYISVRTLGAAATAFIISLLLAPWLIRKLRIINFGEQKEDERVAALDRSRKIGTPTMGGVLIILAASGSALLWAIPTNVYLLITLYNFFSAFSISLKICFQRIVYHPGCNQIHPSHCSTYRKGRWVYQTPQNNLMIIFFCNL